MMDWNIKRLIAYYRAWRISKEVESYFAGTVHNCARVSAVNNALSFVVFRVGVFGGPVVQLIDRPARVALAEDDRCVIVKDGKVYELTQETR